MAAVRRLHGSPHLRLVVAADGMVEAPQCPVAAEAPRQAERVLTRLYDRWCAWRAYRGAMRRVRRFRRRHAR
jgi:hypothetical protein